MNFFDFRSFVVGQNTRDNFFDAEPLCNRLSRAFVVAREHDNTCAELLKLFDCLRGSFFLDIGDENHAENFFVIRENQRRLAFVGQRGNFVAQSVEIETALHQKSFVAREVFDAVNLSTNAATKNRLKIFGDGRLKIFRRDKFRDGFGKRMFTAAFD